MLLNKKAKTKSLRIFLQISFLSKLKKVLSFINGLWGIIGIRGVI